MRIPSSWVVPLAVVVPLLAAGGAPVPQSILTIGRLQYEGGGDWYANPSSLPNLLRAIRERTELRTAEREQVVSLDDPDLWRQPYLYMTGHGNVSFAERHLPVLRRYLRQGGFLHVDDNYGMDESVRREFQRLFPTQALQEVPLDHAIYNVVYRMPEGIPKIHQHDGNPAQGFGIFLDGRLAVFYSFESDLGDGWEDPQVHDDPEQKREQALRMGVNLFAYAVGYGG